MASLIRISNTLLDPDAIESVETYIDQKSHNQCVRVHMRGGAQHSFGTTLERFRQLLESRLG